MDFYKQRSIWNIVLLVVGITILLITAIYANYLAGQLSSREDKIKDLFEQATSFLATNEDLEQDMTIPDQIRSHYNLPMIYEFEGSERYEGNNWGESLDTSQIFLAKKVAEFKRNGAEPIYGKGITEGYTIYTFNSPLATYIRFFPIIQFLLIGLFLTFAYLLINATRRAEQNRVWAGMAKETAHQLGTPISAIIAWIEHLKESNVERPEQLEVIGELNKDVERLELIADRFSKIGSDPELALTNLYSELHEMEAYMKRRSSRKVVFDFPNGEQEMMVRINSHLFNWVLENLIRNSLDALDGQGTISANILKDDHWVTLNLSDTGKGIPTSKFKQVFRPGFSTKQRGWGLGLSLAKRIIEDYHKGKIFVKNSKVNEGTTFTIQLPVV